MPGFFFRPVDLSSLALLFVALLVAGRLWTLRPRTGASRWLTLFFGSAAAFALFSIVASARLDAWRFLAVHLQIVASALGVAGLLQYAYRAGDVDPDDIEARGAWWLSLAAFAFVLGWALYQFWQLTPQGSPSTSTAISEGLIGLGLLWTLVVAVRRARNSARRAGSYPNVSQLVMLIVGVALLLAANSFQFFGGLSSRFVPDEVYTIYGVALAVIVIGFNYFLYWDRANTRVNRVIAAALVLMQSVFAVLAILYGAQLAAEPVPLTVLGNAAYRFSPDDAGGYGVETVDRALQPIDGQIVDSDECLIEPDFPVTFFGEEYETLLSRRGRLLFGEEWSPQKANYYLQPFIFVANLAGPIEQELQAEVSQTAERVTVRWSLAGGEAAQVSIDRDGVLELSYRGLSQLQIQNWGLSAGMGLDGVDFLVSYPPDNFSEVPEAGVLFDEVFYYRIRQDAWTRPIWFFQLVMSVLVVAILYAVRGRLDTLDRALVAQSLNVRQLEIAQLVAAGHSNADIAEALSVTENTVKYHLKRIFGALDINSREELAAWYREKA